MRYKRNRNTTNKLIDVLQPTIKPLKEYRRGELAKELLKGVALTGIVATVVVLPGSAQILQLFEVEEDDDKKRLQDSLYRMKSQGMISLTKKNNKQIYTLTKKGEEKLQKLLISEIEFPIENKWDGYWRCIMFDIPNTKKRARDLFSSKLREVGCVQFQKSIYVYPYACRSQLDQLLDFYFLNKYAQYLVVLDSNEFDHIRKKFNFKKPSKKQA